MLPGNVRTSLLVELQVKLYFRTQSNQFTAIQRNFSPLCINTAYFQWIRCPEFRVVGGLWGPLFILRECQTLIWTPQNSRRLPAARRPARGQRPQRDLPTFQTLRRTRAEPRSTCRGNYHDEEKTLGMILVRVRTAHGAPSFPQILHSHQMARGPRSVGPLPSEPTYT